MPASGPPLGVINSLTQEVQEMLVKLGYLPKDLGASPPTPEATARAVLRFQRHAARTYRMPQPDVAPGDVFFGQASGVLNGETVAEMKKWLNRGWEIPIGRIKLKSISVANGFATLREDAATAWLLIVGAAQSQGATLEGPYGDSLRPLRPTAKVGTSRYSFHYCGRAIDINQKLADPPGQRYYVAKDPAGGRMFWRIYCRTRAQDGQGTLLQKGQMKWFSFFDQKEYDIPNGRYIDLTQVIQSTGTFERISAQGGWQSANSKTEWWHFQYKLDKQPTFLDEMELIGDSEARLQACGWNSPTMLDHAPG